MNSRKIFILITLLYPINSLMAMEALRSKQADVAKEKIESSSKQISIKKAEPSSDLSALKLDDIQMRIKLIDLEINKLKYDESWDERLALKDFNPINFAKRLQRDIDVLHANGDEKLMTIYILFFLWQQVINMINDETSQKEFKSSLEQSFKILRTRQSKTAQNPPQNIDDLRALIIKDITPLYLDNLIGYYFEYSRKMTFPWIDGGIEDYFGNQFADYYLKRREEYLGEYPKEYLRPKWHQIPLDETITPQGVITLANEGKICTLYGLQVGYSSADVRDNKEALETRRKRLLKFHPDKNPGKEKDATRAMQYINDFYDHIKSIWEK